MKKLDDLDPDALKAALAKLETEKELRGPDWVQWSEDTYFNTETRCIRCETSEGVELIFTGVPRPSRAEREAWAREDEQTAPALDAPLAPAIPESIIPDQQSTYFFVEVECREGDCGEIAEAVFSVEAGRLILRDTKGKELGSQSLGPDDAPELVARRLLRATREGFDRKLN